MSEEKKEQDTSLDDIEKPLNGIVAWVQTKKEESKKQGSPWSWLTAVLVSFLAIISMALMAYEAWKKGMEVAKLKHKVDVTEELKKQAEINSKISAETDKVEAQKAFAKEMEKQIDSLLKEIDDTEKERLLIHKKISKVTSWEGIDSFLNPKT
jgi:hypothetical protein